MKIPLKTLRSGFSLPVFGFGTWEIGGGRYRNFFNPDKVQVNAIIRAIKAGITHIDTAESYANGYAEELISRAIKNFDRKKLIITSKVWPTHLKYKQLINSAANSLKRLKTGYLDLYLIHMPNPGIPISETIRALDKLKDEGLIRNIGVSNFSVSSLKAAQQASKNKIVVNQVHYNFIYREPETSGLLEYCQKNDVFLVAWRPVEKGMLAGFSSPHLDKICRKYKKSPAQIAINWLISQKNVVTLAKMVDPRHLQENLGALDFRMERTDIEKLRRDFPGQQPVSSAVPLR